MPVEATHLTTDGSTADATSYNTASISPSPNKLVLMAVCSTGAINVCSATGAGMTWTVVRQKQDTINASRQITLFRALSGSPSSGAVTIDFAGETQGRCAWTIVEFGNVDFGGTNGANAVVQSADTYNVDDSPFSVTLAAFSDPNNATFGAFAPMANNVTVITSGTGFTELGEYNPGTELVAIQSQWKNSNDTSVDWTFTSNTDVHLGVAAEIKFLSGGGAFLLNFV